MIKYLLIILLLFFGCVGPPEPDDGLIDNSRKLGKKFHNYQNQLKNEYPDFISWTIGKGLIAAILFHDKKGKPLTKLCDRIAELCLQRGLLVVHTGMHSIKIAPPLMIDKEPMFEGLGVFRDSVIDAIEEL